MYRDFFHTLKTKYNIHLNPQQQEAVCHKDGPAIVLAVPGAGKTTVLICRTANLILHHKIDAKNILSLTFSNASAKDMKDRFYRVFGDKIDVNVYFSTIHGFALSIIKRYAAIHQIKYTIIEGKNAPVHKAILLKQFYHQVNKEFLNDDQLEALSNAIGYVKNAMIDTKDFSSHTFEIDGFQQIYVLYEKYKRKNNYIDFDDMLHLALKILQSNPHLLNQYQKHYPYIQVDEAQDTSKLQHTIIRLLVHPKNNIFMVADDDQSIYGFRGAFPKALLQFDRTYKHAKTFFMEQNYRSTHDIVTVSNAFIKSNSERYAKHLFTKNQGNQPIAIIHVANEREQTNYIVDQLKHTKALYDTAILFRNNISAIPFIDQLERNNIAFYMRGLNMHFFNHWIVQDIIAFFDLALNPYDMNAFERIYFKMNGYISKAILHTIKHQHLYQSVFDRLLNYEDLRSYQKDNLLRLRSDFVSLSKKKPLEAILFIENDLTYKKYLQSHCQRMRYSYESMNMILSHLKILASEAATLIEFLQRFHELQKIIEASKYNKNKSAVVLSTIHSVKGLEFDDVYMVDLIDGQFPTKNSIDLLEEEDVSSLEEERRLFYVGMTRARKMLTLLVMDFKEEMMVKPSRFVKEVKKCMAQCYPNDIIKTIDTKGFYKKHQKHYSFKNLENNSIIHHDYTVGMPVYHEKFGKGIVTSIHKDVIQIDFDAVGRRNLSLSICLEQKILQIQSSTG
ncbi:ATP-dependent helicase [Clostridiaceae bacterium 35-E11]